MSFEDLIDIYFDPDQGPIIDPDTGDLKLIKGRSALGQALTLYLKNSEHAQNLIKAEQGPGRKLTRQRLIDQLVRDWTIADPGSVDAVISGNELRIELDVGDEPLTATMELRPDDA